MKHPCLECNGVGELSVSPSHNGNDPRAYDVPCGACGGTGEYECSDFWCDECVGNDESITPRNTGWMGGPVKFCEVSR